MDYTIPKTPGAETELEVTLHPGSGLITIAYHDGIKYHSVWCRPDQLKMILEKVDAYVATYKAEGRRPPND